MRLPGLDIPLPAALSDAGRLTVEGVLALTAGLMLARIVWLAAGGGVDTPAPALTANPPAESLATASVLELSNPFRPGAVLIPSLAAAPTSLNLQLTGLRSASENEQGGTAVITLPDGQQKRFETGDIILPGAVLEAVTPERVFLRVNGQLEELTRQVQPMQSFTVPGAARKTQTASTHSPAPAAPSSQQPASVTPSQLMTDIALQPEFRDGAITGYRMSPRGAGHFEAAGLEPGDLILRVNGQSVEGLRPETIQGAISSGDELALDMVRNGRIIRMRLSGETGLSQ